MLREHEQKRIAECSSFLIIPAKRESLILIPIHFPRSLMQRLDSLFNPNSQLRYLTITSFTSSFLLSNFVFDNHKFLFSERRAIVYKSGLLRYFLIVLLQ